MTDEQAISSPCPLFQGVTFAAILWRLLSGPMILQPKISGPLFVSDILASPVEAWQPSILCKLGAEHREEFCGS
jgi:hypothetical protein